MKSISAGTVTVGVIAIVLGLLAAYVVRRSLDTTPPKAEVKKDEGVPMVVAKANIPRNTKILPGHLEVKKVPANKLPEGAVQLPALLVDRVTKEAIEAGEMITEDRVLGVGEKVGLTHKLEPGYRALPILITGSNMAATFLSAGTHVDIHMTFEDARPEIGGHATRTILQNVKVIAKGHPSGRANSRDVNANFVTVAVTNDQANRLITAQKTGTLSITLCGDREVAGGPRDGSTEALTSNDIKGLNFAPPYEVEKWNGTTMVKVVIAPNRIREAHEATAADEARQKGRSIPASLTEPIVGGGVPDFLADGK